MMQKILSVFRPEYRVARDNYCGYEVQFRRWWFPIWVPAGLGNTHVSLERAEQYAEIRANKVIKHLGKL